MKKHQKDSIKAAAQFLNTNEKHCFLQSKLHRGIYVKNKKLTQYAFKVQPKIPLTLLWLYKEGWNNDTYEYCTEEWLQESSNTQQILSAFFFFLEIQVSYNDQMLYKGDIIGNKLNN